MQRRYLKEEAVSGGSLKSRLAVRVISLTVSLFGLLMLSAWIFDQPAGLVLPPESSMPAATALGFVLAGAGLLFSVDGPRLKKPLTAKAIVWSCSVLLLAFGLVTLAAYQFNRSPGIPELSGSAGVLGRFALRPMPVLNALNFSLLGLILLVRQWQPRTGKSLCEIFAVAVLGSSGLALLGYLLSPGAIHPLSAYASISLQTGILFVLLALGTLLAFPQMIRTTGCYGLALAAVAVALASYLKLSDSLGRGLPPFISFYSVVMLVSLLGGIGPGLFALAMSYFAVVIWLYQPAGLFVINSAIDHAALLLFLANGLLINLIIHLYREHRQKVLTYERAQAEQSLRAVHDTFRHLVENSPFGIYVVDANFRLAQVSAGAQKVFERVRPLIGRDFAEVLRLIWPEPFASDAIARFRHTLQTGEAYHAPSTVEKRLDSGELESYDWKIERITLPNGRHGVVCHFYDLSERQRYEAELRASEERFRAVFENAGIGIAIANWNGQFEHCNPAYCRLLGYSQEELKRMNFEDLIHPEDRPANLLQNKRLAQEELSFFETENRYLNKAGETVWVRKFISVLRDYTGAPSRLVALITDMTQHKQAEEALRASEQTLLDAQRGARAGVWEVDLAAGRVSWSEPFYELYGLPRSLTPSNENWLASIHPDDLRLVQDEYIRALEARDVQRVEFRIIRNGQIRWLHSEGRVLCGPDQRPARISGITWDITERKVAELALQDADQRKNEFLAMLAHELRNPLAPISNGLHILRMPGIDPNTVENVYEMMQRQVNQMIRLVDDLMEVSRITRGKIELRKEKTDLAEVLRSAAETSRPLIEKARHELDVSFPSEPLVLEADKIRLTQVVANLLNNAAKYTQEGGRICLSVRRDGPSAVISIRDNGMGIPPDMLSKVFDLFTQVGESSHRSQGGLGIGLTLVKSLVNLHGGAVEVNSEGLNKGSEFIVRLPLAEPSSLPEGLPVSNETSPIKKVAHRILIADDNRDAAESLAPLLSQMGAETMTVDEGRAALETLATFRPSVILLDIGMPGMDGFETARRIRRQPEGKAVTLIALTGWGQEEDRRRSKEAGFDHHLVKPVDLTVLRKLLTALPINGNAD